MIEITRMLATIVMVTAGVALAGWSLDNEALKGVESMPMSPLAAIAFVLASLSIFAATITAGRRSPPRIGKMLGLIVSAIGVFVTVGKIFRHFGMDGMQVDFVLFSGKLHGVSVPYLGGVYFAFLGVVLAYVGRFAQRVAMVPMAVMAVALFWQSLSGTMFVPMTTSLVALVMTVASLSLCMLARGEAWKKANGVTW